MDTEQSGPNPEPPFFPSGYTPEVNESDSGYNSLLHVRESNYSGPIPPPDSLEYYEQILPGAADRILRMAEENAKSIRESNSRQLDLDQSVEENRHDETNKGQNFGIVAVLSMVSLAALALFLGYPGVAVIICSATILGIATVFVTGRRPQKLTKEEKPTEGERV